MNLPPSHLSTTDYFAATTHAPLIYNIRVRRPLDRSGFTHPLSLITILSSIPIPSYYKQVVEHEYWQKDIETEFLALEEN